MYPAFEYNMSYGLFRTLFGVIASLLIIALVTALIVHIAKESKAAFASNPNVKNPGVLNALLFLGSAFIVFAIISMIDDQAAAMPAVLISSSLVTLIGGIVLYRLVSFLKPIGLAFAYIGMALMPFWYFALNEIGLGGHASLIISTALSLVSFTIGAIGVNSHFAGWCSFLWLILLGIVIPESNTKFAIYALFLWPVIVAFIPMLFWSFRVKWLPVAFRRASQMLTYIIPSIMAVIWYVSVLIPNMGQDYPFLRTAMAALMLIYFISHWAKERLNSSMVCFRISIQVLLLCIAADAMNYSLFSAASEGAKLAMSIMWAAGFTIQAGVSVAVSAIIGKTKPSDVAITIISLACVMIAPLFMISYNMENTTSFFIMTAISGGLTAAIAAATSWLLHNVNWHIATWLGILTVPTALMNGVFTAPNWAIFATYAGISLLPVAMFAIDARKGGKRMLLPSSLAIVSCAVTMRMHSYCGDFSLEALAYFITACDVALCALIAKSKNAAEVAIYLAAIAARALAINIYDFTNSNVAARYFDYRSYFGMIGSTTTDALMALGMVNALILGGTVLGVGFWRERGQKSQPRLIIGYILFTLLSFNVAESAHAANLYVWPLIFLVGQVILMIIGVFAKKKWMTITSIICACVDLALFVNGPVYIWLLAAGVTLITVVVVQLTRNRKPVEAPKEAPKVEAVVQEKPSEEK